MRAQNLLLLLLLLRPAQGVPTACSVTTLAGTRGADESVDGNAYPGGLASFGYPAGLALDAARQSLLVADAGRGKSRPTNGNRVRRLALASGALSTAAGSGLREPFADGPAAAASLKRPTSVAVDAAGNVYIADSGNFRVRFLNASSGEVSTLAGTDVRSAADGPLGAGTLRDPVGVCYNPDRGSVEVLEYTFSTVRSVSLAGGAARGNLSTPAGVPGEVFQLGLVDGVGSDVRFQYPFAMAYSPTQRLYVIADQWNHAIRFMVLNAGDALATVGTLAGTGARGALDGPRGVAQFTFPSALAFDESPDLPGASLGVLVMDRTQRLRYVDLAVSALGNVTSLAGNGSVGWADGGGASAGLATFNFPDGVAHLRNDTRVAAQGLVTFLVADTLNCLLRAVVCSAALLPSASPAALPSGLPTPSFPPGGASASAAPAASPVAAAELAPGELAAVVVVSVLCCVFGALLWWFKGCFRCQRAPISGVGGGEAHQDKGQASQGEGLELAPTSFWGADAAAWGPPAPAAGSSWGDAFGGLNPLRPGDGAGAAPRQPSFLPPHAAAPPAYRQPAFLPPTADAAPSAVSPLQQAHPLAQRSYFQPPVSGPAV